MRRYAAQSTSASGPRSSCEPPPHRACASIPGTRMPLPSHQGHATSLGVPPRFEITLPLPRQGIHSRGWWASSVRSSLPVLSLATPR